MPAYTTLPVTLRPPAPQAAIYVSSCYYICVLILIYVSSYYYVCPHSTICVLMLLHMSPHTTIYMSSYCDICVLILLSTRRRRVCSPTLLSPRYYLLSTTYYYLLATTICSPTLLSPLATIYSLLAGGAAARQPNIYDLMLLHMSPHTTIHMSSYCDTCVRILLSLLAGCAAARQRS